MQFCTGPGIMLLFWLTTQKHKLPVYNNGLVTCGLCSELAGLTPTLVMYEGHLQ